MTYTVWDLETTITTLNKRKASPFGKVNIVVASGWKKSGMAKAVGEYFGRETPPSDWFLKLLHGTKLLVGFNIKFDILHAINQSKDNYAAWMDWVAEGGRIWDAQLAEYLIHGMAREHHMLSLDEVAPRYGGHLKDDAVKALWQAGIDTTEIDRDMLMEYLVGAPGQARDLGDIGNTELVFLGQVQALRARGGLQAAMLNMDALIAIVEMEHNGMYIDKPLGLKIAAELEEELASLRTELNAELPAGLPFEFNWGSRFHLSALIFGGDIKYKAKATILDGDGNPTYYQKEEVHWLLINGTTTPTPPSENSANIFDYSTFAGGKNKGEYKTKKVKGPDLARGPKERYEDFFYHFDGYTTPLPEWKTSVDGVYSTASEVINSLEGSGIPFLEKLAKMAALVKDLGTYFITTDENGEQSGMLTLVGADGVIHHSINSTSTVTGRFSSSNPNLQNVSSGNKSQVKTVFRSRFHDGFILQSDFTSLEVYVQAILTEDLMLISDLRSGKDMHCVRAAAWKKTDYEFVLAAAKDENHPEHKVWHYIRKASKVFSFQRSYGAGNAKIAKYTGMPEEEVAELARAEDARYSMVGPYYDKLTETLKQNRVPTNRFVQHPEVPAVQCQLGRSHFTTPDGTVYSYSEQPLPKWAMKPGKAPQGFSPTEIKNYVVQGTGAAWAKAAMALAVRMFYRHRNFGGLALLVNQVHDAIYIDADKKVYIQAGAMLHACMEEASAYMEHLFKWKIALPVPTETKHGTSMIEELDMPKEFKTHVTAYRKLIRDTMMNGFITANEVSNGV